MLFPFFEWCESTALGTVVRNSIWAFPMIEAVHLLGLCLLGGALLVVDLRLLGFGLKNQGISELARSARPWMIAAVVLMIVTGVPLFLSEAVKCYYNRSFWVKMITFPIALAFTFLIRARLIRQDTFDTSAKSRVVGVASMLVWFTVAAAGRWIGFS